MRPCYIIEDEPLGLRILEEYINKTNMLTVLEKFHCLSDAWNAIFKNHGVLIYIDVNFKGVSVKKEDVISILSQSNKIIFVTAYPKSHLIAHDLIINNELGYLNKPFSYNTFLKELKRVLSSQNNNHHTF